MVLGKTFSINIPEVKFSFTPRYKFSVILGESGTGKSYLIQQIGNNAMDTDIRRFAASADMGLINNKHEFLVAFDEVDFNRFLKAHSQSVLNKSPNAFLIVARSIPKSIPVHYQAIYEFNKNYTKEYVAVPKYPKYWQFKMSSKIFVEDSGAGLDYYRYRCQNALVNTINGKSGCLQNKLSQNSTLVADGAVFGQILNCLMSYKIKPNMFLPDSFEGLVLEHTPRAKTVVDNSRTDSCLEYLSIERYYTDKILDYYPRYLKSKLHNKLYSKDLLSTNIYQHPYFDKFGFITIDDKRLELERLASRYNDVDLIGLLYHLM